MDIAFLLSDGFAARMVIRSGVANRLVTNGARVTVVSPNADEAYFRDECHSQGIILRQAPELAHRIATRFRAYRQYFLDDVTKSPTLTAHHERRFKDYPLSGLAMKAVNRALVKSRALRGCYRTLETRVNRSRHVKELLRELGSNLLVLMNPFGTDTSVYLLHAKELRIPVVCQMGSWDNITAKGTPLLMPDYFISWGPIMTQEMMEVYHFPRARIFECGVPHFDVYAHDGRFTPRNKILSDLSLPPGLPYIFYGMVAERYCPNELQIVRWLAERINQESFAKPCSLVIRPHPLMLSGIYSTNDQKLQELRALAGPRVAVDIPRIVSERLPWDLPKGDMHYLASLLAGSTMCLNASSTLCLDACMVDRPVVNIGFDGRESLPYQGSARQSLDFIHMAKLLAFGGVRVARSFPDLESLINAYLVNPQLDQEARSLSVTQECGPRDGRASERVADTLLRLAREMDLSHSASRSGSDELQ